MKQFKNILYIAEPGADRQEGLERAVALAENNQARLTVLYVWEGVPEAVGPLGDLREQLRRRSLERFEEETAPLRGRAAELDALVLFGSTYLEVIREVLRTGRDLVIKSAEGRIALKERLFGSTDMHLLRKCPCPVWLMKSGTGPYRRIMATVDFSPSAVREEEEGLNGQILELAVSLAISEFAELHVVHAWEAIAESIMHVWGDTTSSDITQYVESERRRHQTEFDRLTGKLSGRIGPEALEYVNPRQHMPRGAARHVIPALASDLGADLVVMGTVGRTGIPGLLMGNTAETILNQLECSVLAVKPPGFVSPVQLE